MTTTAHQMNESFKVEMLNPGESVNRPRYTVNFWRFSFVSCVAISYYNWLARESQWTVCPFPTIVYQAHVNFYLFLVIIGVKFDFRVFEKPEYLKIKAKNVFAAFIERTQLIYVGINDIKLTNVGGVLHPVDNFVKHWYDRYCPKECETAMLKYKRTNPTLELRLAHIEKYATTYVDHVPVSELEDATDSILLELSDLSDFSRVAQLMRNNVEYRAFDSLVIDGTSASGFPYPQGRKKKQDTVDAVHQANLMIDDDEAFANYASKHVWYTTGRAKMQLRDALVASRLIIYSGYSFFLMSMLILQPWSRFMNKTFDWCGVGFSWMHGGAGKFAEFFQAKRGFAPEGFRFVSLDISGWDSKLHPDIMKMLLRFYRGLLKMAIIDSSYSDKYLAIVNDMIEAVILMPMGYTFKVLQGMKSGWGGTANDNTMLHEIVFRCIMKRTGYMRHVLYGDDNFILVPDHISDATISDEYARFGMRVKVIHSSKYIGDVDFLSKYIKYADNQYYVYRDDVETHSRLLMPEEMDPRRRNRPDAVIATERVLGHLLDNPFNSRVRRICYQFLYKLRDEYGVLYIDCGPEVMKKHPWRSFDRALIPFKFPSVPTEAFIEELYGVTISENLNMSWPELPAVVHYDQLPGELSCMYYLTAARFARDVQAQIFKLASRKYRNIIRAISPYEQPKRCYGFHAARLEFAMNYFQIECDRVIDFGSHPGACAASLVKYARVVTCVSLFPDRDHGREFCPYVVRDSNVKKIIADANSFRFGDMHFDLMHDDVDIVGTRTMLQEIAIGHDMIDRAIRYRPSVDRCLFTIKEIDSLTYLRLYKLYLVYGGFKIVKPVFSNPWKSEFMVYGFKCKKPAIKISVFKYKFYAFLNSMARSMFDWNHVVLSSLTKFEGVGAFEPHPSKDKSSEIEWIKPWVGWSDLDYKKSKSCRIQHNLIGRKARRRRTANHKNKIVNANNRLMLSRYPRLGSS